MAYAADYAASKKLLELDGDDAEAFEAYVKSVILDDHEWEVVLVPSIIHLRPILDDGKFAIELIIYSIKGNYDQLVHLALGLRKMGVPVKKPVGIEEKISGEQFVRIVPLDDSYYYEYEEHIWLKADESAQLPLKNNEALIKEIDWFPVGAWHLESI